VPVGGPLDSQMIATKWRSTDVFDGQCVLLIVEVLMATKWCLTNFVQLGMFLRQYTLPLRMVSELGEARMWVCLVGCLCVRPGLDLSVFSSCNDLRWSQASTSRSTGSRAHRASILGLTYIGIQSDTYTSPLLVRRSQLPARLYARRLRASSPHIRRPLLETLPHVCHLSGVKRSWPSVQS
jgi:hypothetical protein